MGRASQHKQLRRLAAEQDDFKAWYKRQAARPEVAAVHAAALADEELQARLKADTSRQLTRLRRAGWVRVTQGSDGAGWHAHPAQGLKLIHSVNRESDGNLWGHFSMSLYGEGRLPTWYELRDAQWLLYPEHVGIQVVAPPEKHYSIAEVLHVWTCLTADVLPAFGRLNTI
jgi:hypothetical protein